jgi:gluconolactonase
VSAELAGPNGLAFSPDERVLYVGNWDPDRKVVMRYPVKTDGALEPGTVLVDLTNEAGDEAIDGVKVDVRGNVYVSGPGGLWIVSAEGRKLGLIRPTEQPANFAWGDADGQTLYMTARTGLYRLRTLIPGIRPEMRPS